MLETNISRVTENMKRRQEIVNLLSQMQRDEKQLKELADAITILRCSMEMKMKFLSSFE
ncbi:hypothetical protein Hanom_Chr05g00423251 [Helianthus anomalus]